ncbi:unnamed protein product [Calicophoron daubneyi]|uniref:Uncharacterized protein n=1 Tax=Calicophoron daubneyi TaxID=300641 RepID=A0AAV2U1D9_CALDB
MEEKFQESDLEGTASHNSKDNELPVDKQNALDLLEMDSRGDAAEHKSRERTKMSLSNGIQLADDIFERTDQKELQVRLEEAHRQSENFRKDVMRLREERMEEQKELLRLVDEVRQQLKINENAEAVSPQNSPPYHADVKLNHLQDCVDQLLDTNADQERLMSELTARLESSNRQITRYTRGVEGGRAIVTSFRAKYALSLKKCSDSEDPAEVIGEMRDCLECLGQMNDAQSSQLRRLETQLNTKAREYRDEIEKMKEDHAQKIQDQYDKFHKEMLQTIHRAESAITEARSLSLQATSLRTRMEDEMKTKTGMIARLEAQLKEQAKSGKQTGVESRTALETALDKSEKQSAKLRCERDSAVSQHSVLAAKLAATEAYMAELEDRLSQQAAIHSLMKQQIEESNHKNSDLQRLTNSLIKAAKKLNKALGARLGVVIRKTCKISGEGGSKEGAVSALISQTVELTEQLLQDSRGLKHRRKSKDRLVREMMQEVEKLRTDFDSCHHNLETTRKSLANQTADLERVLSERDYYLELLNERTDELLTLKADYHRQIKENEKLNRAKSRLDELTQQVNLLDSPSKSCNIPVVSEELHRNRKYKRNHHEVRTGCEGRRNTQHFQATENPGKVSKESDHTSRRTKEDRECQPINSVPDCAAEKLRDFLTKFNRFTKARQYVKAAQRDLELAQSSIITKNSEGGQTLDKDFTRRTDEHRELRNRNQELTALLIQVSEQNQRLKEQLEESAIAYSRTTTKSPYSTTIQNDLSGAPKESTVAVISAEGVSGDKMDECSVAKSTSFAPPPPLNRAIDPTKKESIGDDMDDAAKELMQPALETKTTTHLISQAGVHPMAKYDVKLNGESTQGINQGFPISSKVYAPYSRAYQGEMASRVLEEGMPVNRTVLNTQETAFVSSYSSRTAIQQRTNHKQTCAGTTVVSLGERTPNPQMNEGLMSTVRSEHERNDEKSALPSNYRRLLHFDYQKLRSTFQEETDDNRRSPKQAQEDVKDISLAPSWSLPSLGASANRQQSDPLPLLMNNEALSATDRRHPLPSNSGIASFVTT